MWGPVKEPEVKRLVETSRVKDGSRPVKSSLVSLLVSFRAQLGNLAAFGCVAFALRMGHSLLFG